MADPWPLSPYATVRARFADVSGDGPDPDAHPDWTPAEGERVTLTPSISGLLVYDPQGPDPIIIRLRPLPCVVDADGWLVTDPGAGPVRIPATDDPLMTATGWTWTAVMQSGTRVTFSAPSGGVVELADFVTAPAVDATQSWVDGIPLLVQTAEDLRDAIAEGGGGVGGSAGLVTADDTPAAPAEGESASFFVTSAVVWPAGLVWSTDPDGGVAPTITGTALVSMFTVGDVTRAIMGATFPAVGAPEPDITPPTAGSMAVTGVTGTGFTATITGAADAGGLNAAPYAFSTDNGATWTAYQASNVFVADTLTPSTTYQVTWRVRDAVGLVTDGTPQAVTTSAAVASSPVSVAYLTSATGAGGDAVTPATFAGVSVGTASATRTVIVAVALAGISNWAAATSVSIGGVSATRDIAKEVVDGGIGIWRATVPVGATADIIVGCDRAFKASYVGVWWSASAAVPLDTASAESGDLSLDTIAGSAIVSAILLPAHATIGWSASVAERWNTTGKLSGADGSGTGSAATISTSSPGIKAAVSYAAY